MRESVATSSLRTASRCVHRGIYLQGVGGSVSRAPRGGGARARADSVGAFASEHPRQVLDGVGVDRDGPSVNFPQVSKEREIREQRATHGRDLHVVAVVFLFRCDDKHRVGEKTKPNLLFGNIKKTKLCDKVHGGLGS